MGMKIWFIMGTAAELIKMYPLIQKAEDAKLDWYLWSTGQGHTNFWKQYDDFMLPRSRSFSTDAKARDLQSSGQAALWFARNVLKSQSQLTKLIFESVQVKPSEKDLVVVHGDTFSTLMGSFFAKTFSMKLAHVEAGMRSGSWRNPFPEELNRRWVSRLTDLHFAPDENAAQHLRSEEQDGEIIVSGGNSVYDALLSTLARPRSSELPQGKYSVANLHRFENLQSASRWSKLIETALQAQKRAPLYFVMHPPAEYRLNQDLDAKRRLEQAGVILQSRLSYTKFVHLLAGADFVLTDGGSNQTECAYLGLPCLILREHTELPEGLGENCVLSQFDSKKIDLFFENIDSYRRPQQKFAKSPSQIIFERLAQLVQKESP
jgi:UDP-N-acetylglucosamine 2-epimerase (non-hydrolysing)